MELALKIDVDTYDGMRDGVPNFLRLFREQGIQASFFIPFGPDQSGRAILRVFKKKGFLKKMMRTNPVKLYGIKTMLRGTLLPAPMIGSSFPDLVKAIQKEGHELAIHGYNHVLWQDHLLEMEENEVRKELERGVEAFRKSVGKKPHAFAAPAWLCSETSFKMMDEFGFQYASDTRGRAPFYPVMNGVRFKTLQVPSTLPTVDEILGLGGLKGEKVGPELTRSMNESGIQTHVHSIHTEVEGTALFNLFAGWIGDLKKSGVRFLTVGEIAERSKSHAPTASVELGDLPGRAGKVACQR